MNQIYVRPPCPKFRHNDAYYRWVAREKEKENRMAVSNMTKAIKDYFAHRAKVMKAELAMVKEKAIIEKKAMAKAEADWYEARIEDYRAFKVKAIVLAIPPKEKEKEIKAKPDKFVKFDFAPTAEIVAGLPVNLTKEERKHEAIIVREWDDSKRRFSNLEFSARGVLMTQLEFQFSDPKIIIPVEPEIEVPEIPFPIVSVVNYPTVVVTA